MKTSVAVASAATALVAVSILAVPAVASGSDFLAQSSDSSKSQLIEPASSQVAAEAASPERGLVPLITAWGAGGVLLFGGGAVAVGASVRRQRKLSA